MRIGKGWLVLTLGERMSALEYAAYLSRKRWEGRRVR